MNNVHSTFTTDGGITFGYDHHKNTLLSEDGVPLVFDTSNDNAAYIAFAKNTYGLRKKSNTPRALRILMGHACNYSCT